VIDRVFTVSEGGQVHVAEAAAQAPEHLVVVLQPVRARVLRGFARAGPCDPAAAHDMAGWHHGGGSLLRPLRLTPIGPALAFTETSF